ncbi:Two-component transcriptional response regulator, LuxR family [hydrothermal vent metagenome]|uniref:Two-component transcriptional response regulator, LuxR family n=1 Tax=hydrothermal vent metagenome TaxID=652676 RepID=A0A3B0ZB99_9ZZZZ
MEIKKSRLLIVEDEVAIRTGLVDVFVYHGYEIDWADDGLQGLKKALNGTFDLVLLDVMLPGMNGFEICNQIRQQDLAQPIIMLTAKSSDEDIIQGLTLGADDYVIKPFSVAQLVLRVQAVLRRSQMSIEKNSYIHLGDGTLIEKAEIDIENLVGQRGNHSFKFTRREMEILEYLNINKTRPVSREELLLKVWGYSKEMSIETRTVDIHIAKLRRKMEQDPKSPKYLITVRGAGYRLMPN